MCQACCPRPSAPRINRAQFLKLAGLATTGAALSAGCTSAGEPSGRTVVDNVRGFTLTARGPRTFGNLFIEADGRVGGLDVADVENARRIDGRGRVLIPGLNDAHGHFARLGASITQLDLSETGSLEQAMRALKRYARENPDKRWIEGRGWNEVVWGLGRLPTAADLDAVVPDRPVWLVRIDGHAGVANTAALRVAGIDVDTPTPEGGMIVRRVDGTATGALIDAAQELVEKHLPTPTVEEVRQRFVAAQHRLNEVGLTAVSDAGTSATELAVLHQLASAGDLTVRTNSFLSWDAYSELRTAARGDSFARDMLRVRTVKLYVDGALGSHGAAMLEPYSDKPESSGLLQLDLAELSRRVGQIMHDGYQVATHAIGDAGNRMVLDAYEAALAAHRTRLRPRIEHAQVLAVSDIPRFTESSIIASMQPMHATDDMNMAESRIGRPRMAGAYAWRTLLDHGTTIASGSDFPVSSENPFDGLHAAVTRTDHEGRPPGGWYGQQAMTPVEALRSFTLDAAYASHQERLHGSLEPGKWADFVLLDRDPLDPPKGRARWQTKVLQTWVAGQRVGQYASL